MGRKKKESPNHGSLYEIKITVGHKLNGSPIRKSFYSPTSKDDARKQAKQWEVNKEVAERTKETFIEKDVTFAAWAKKWLETYKKPTVDENTYRMTYEQTTNNHLVPYFGKADLKSIRPVDVQAFLAKKENFSKSVLSKIHMCLNSIFETAIENDLCYKNPVKNVSYKSKREKNTKKIYSDKQIEKIKEYSKDKMPEVIVLLETGLRRGELLGLMWNDFDESKKCISVNRAIADIPKGIKENPPKWNSYRIIPLKDECVAFIKNLPNNGKYIFSKQNGLPQSPNAFSQRLKYFMKKINTDNPDIPILSAHELRHTFGTVLRRHGVDIYTIQKIMGHKDINMTSEIYVHNEIGTLRKDMKMDKKLGTSVVQVSYGRKFKLKRAQKKTT